MQTNYWEEREMAHPILEFHEKKMQDTGLPEWIREIKCPFCKEPISLRAFRSVQLCFNTRNFGEIAIEVFCDDCEKMDTVYFRTKIDNIADFIKCLQGSSNLPKDYVVEEEMYDMNYNNILELMATQTSEEKHDHS